MKRKLVASGVDAGLELAGWIALRLTIDPEVARGLVETGSVFVDGSRARDPLAKMAAGQHVVVQDPVAPLPTSWRVVHRDEEVLVVDKPAGLAVQATREQGGALDEQVAKRWPKARLLHRIDRDTSGLVLFTLTRTARQRLHTALTDGAITREYLAVVDGHPAKDDLTLDGDIAGQKAQTKVHVEKRGVDPGGAPVALVACTLVTGRTHQIRLHLAGAGHPLLGDVLHAPPAVTARASRLALHAARLSWPGGTVTSLLPRVLALLVVSTS